MEPSTIFAIAAGAIIIFGRIINRIAARSGNDADNTPPNFDTQHEFEAEDSIPARQNTSNADTLAGSILAQIIAERQRNQASPEAPQMAYTQRIHTPKFVSNASVAPKPKKANNTSKAKPKAQPQSPKTEGSAISNNTPTSEILEDFDLKKAVIFSEILKPKFDE